MWLVAVDHTRFLRCWWNSHLVRVCRFFVCIENCSVFTKWMNFFRTNIFPSKNRVNESPPVLVTKTFRIRYLFGKLVKIPNFTLSNLRNYIISKSTKVIQSLKKKLLRLAVWRILPRCECSNFIRHPSYIIWSHTDRFNRHTLLCRVHKNFSKQVCTFVNTSFFKKCLPNSDVGEDNKICFRQVFHNYRLFS